MQFFYRPYSFASLPHTHAPIFDLGKKKEKKNSALRSISTISYLSDALGHIVLRNESIRGKSCSMPLENPGKSHPPAVLGGVDTFIPPAPTGQEGQCTVQEEQPSRLRATCPPGRAGGARTLSHQNEET